MTRITFAAIATVAGTGAAMAGGLDRSGQNIEILFEAGNIVELSLGYAAPDVEGRDLVLGNRGTGDVADNFFQGALGYKQDLSDALSFAIIVDQPYGADIAYPTAASGGSLLLGGTTAMLDATAYTGLLRYRINDRVSVHGGIRAQTIDADVTLRGLAYGLLGAGLGYSVSLDRDTAFGYQLGASYEIPEIALRLSATYFSEIDHDFDTRERLPNGLALPASETGVTTPRAININAQTGIAEGTLAFASFRYADYQVTQVRPAFFAASTGGQSLTNIDTGRDFAIGIGRRFTEQFSGAFSLTYSDGGADDLVSPLAPTDGRYGFTVSGSYNVSEQVRLSGGLSYQRLGDARAATGVPQVARTAFESNDLIGVGLRIAYRF